MPLLVRVPPFRTLFASAVVMMQRFSNHAGEILARSNKGRHCYPRYKMRYEVDRNENYTCVQVPGAV